MLLSPHELKRVLFGLWIATLFLAGTIAVAVPMLSPNNLETGILALIPECPAAEEGGRCIACGLTHAIAVIDEGGIEASLQYNSLGVPLWVIALLNLVGGFFSAYIHIIRYMEDIKWVS